jgi:23S rRNA (uracil1939-C5)-methyltransferase
VPLAGATALEERVGTVRLRLSATAFFQVNRQVAGRIYEELRQSAALTGAERVVDCYSGVGGIALTLASGAREVVGIEERSAAVADARASAELSGVSNARFVCGDVAEHLSGLRGAAVVVLNPPRRGCSPAVLEAAARLGPRLLAYVSCAPETLARDLELLLQRGLRPRRVIPYDMLPSTPHVEALALLTPGR